MERGRKTLHSTPKGIQRFKHKQVNELFLNARRVLTLQTSPDGFTWTPTVASDYKRDKKTVRDMRLLHAPPLTAEYHLEQNELDSPDMEFYNDSPFEYEGPYYMVMSNYSGSFTDPAWSPVSSGRSSGRAAAGSIGTGRTSRAGAAA